MNKIEQEVRMLKSGVLGKINLPDLMSEGFLLQESCDIFLKEMYIAPTTKVANNNNQSKLSNAGI